MTARSLWQGLISWLRAMSEAEDPLGQVIIDHDERLTALEKELRLIRTRLHSAADEEPRLS